MRILNVFLITVTVWATSSRALERGNNDASKKMYAMYGTHLWGSPRIVYFKKPSGGSNFRASDNQLGEIVGIPLLIPFQLVNVKDLQWEPHEDKEFDNYESGYENMVGKPFHRKKQRLHQKPTMFRPPAPVVEKNEDDFLPPPYYPNGPNPFTYGSTTGNYDKPKVHYQSIYDDVPDRKYQRHSPLVESPDEINHHLSRPPPPKYKHHHHDFTYQLPSPPPPQRPKFDWQYDDQNDAFLRQEYSPDTKTYPVFMDAVVTPLNCEPDHEALLGSSVSGYELANNPNNTPYKQYYNVNGYDQSFDSLYKEYKSEPPAHKHKTFEDFLYKKLKHGIFFKKFHKFMKKHEKLEEEEHQKRKTYYNMKPHY